MQPAKDPEREDGQSLGIEEFYLTNTAAVSTPRNRVSGGTIQAKVR